MRNQAIKYGKLIRFFSNRDIRVGVENVVNSRPSRRVPRHGKTFADRFMRAVAKNGTHCGW